MWSREHRDGLARAGIGTVVALAIIGMGCEGSGDRESDPAGGEDHVDMPEIAGVKTSKVRDDIAERLAQFAPTPIEADLSGLTDSQRQVLDKLIEASRQMGEIFQRQACTLGGKEERQLSLAVQEEDVHVRVSADLQVGDPEGVPGVEHRARMDVVGISADVDNYILKGNLTAENLRSTILNSRKLRITSIFLYASYKRSRGFIQKIFLHLRKMYWFSDEG